MRVFVGVDDTDNKESRGTGYLSRRLGKLIEENQLGQVSCISRHQLFFDPRIPYTSQNSSACLDIECTNIRSLKTFCRSFLLAESADGSDCGLAISPEDNITDEIMNWGSRAKKEILTQKEARESALQANIYLEGLTGDKDGIIGALAACGLRKNGNDGRCIWLRGKELRELNGIYPINELMKVINADRVIDITGKAIPVEERLDVGDWLRPVLKNNRITIVVEKQLNHNEYEWKTASKDYIKSISD
jgi:hypothetical protein